MGLRMRAYDEIGGVRDYGAWSFVTLSVDNQTAPVVQGIFAQGGLIDGISGAISVEYRVSDAEADLVDITVEYAMDDELLWAPCTEYPDELSHGRYDLPTAEGRGIVHIFRWDSVADIGNAQPDLVRLRIQASDGLNPPLPATLGAVSGRMGMVVGNLAGFTQDIQGLAGAIDPVAMGDFNADGFADAAYFNGTQLVLRLGSSTGLGGFGVIAVANDRPRMAVTRFNADGADDLLIRVDGTTVRPFRGVPGAVTPASTLLAGTNVTSPASPDRDITAGDFDGDGDIDFVINDFEEVRLYLGNGAGAFTLDTNAYGLPTDIFELAAGDFDGDGFADLATASAAPTLLAPIMVWFGQASVAGGPRLGTPVQVTALRYTVDDDAVVDQEEGVVLASGNANGDAFADLGATATELAQNGRTGLLLGSSTRDFARVNGTAIEGRPRTVRFGDVNGDGRQDLVTSTDQEVLGIDRLIPGASPVMQRLSTIDVSSCLTTSPLSHATADVTGDGRSEIVVARRGCDDVLYLSPQPAPAAGSGAFGTPNTVSGSAIVNAFEVADVDSDGLLDALWLDRQSDAAFVFQATADLTHATGGLRLAGVGFFDANISGGLRAPFIADLNGDGLLDGVTHDGDLQQREWVLLCELGQGAGTFGLQPRAVLTSAAVDFLFS
ncbi:MAG TPA: VCBS repeat-containing protein, partial [Myxococcota bacterium]|nr:VCBS repeat-containing protein [Myxococcota bacterium]